jgi:hypothetical protein
VYSEYLTGHAGYLRGAAEDEDEEPDEVVAASASSAAAAWCAEKSRGRDWVRERAPARADGVLFLGAAVVVVQATAVAMETAGDSDGEAKPPCCQTPRR